nr:olfactory receptor 8I2 [Oryctolagus cuniculus]
MNFQLGTFKGYLMLLQPGTLLNTTCSYGRVVGTGILRAAYMQECIHHWLLETHMCAYRCMHETERLQLMYLTGKNLTELTVFILSGFADHPELHVSLFLTFLFIYLFTILGNLGLILLIRADSQLHTPMYFFLSNLAFIDICYSSTVTPEALVNLQSNQKTISFVGCFVQMYFFVGLVCCECFLLGSMAYDRYVAICNPLLYSVVMSPKLCSWLGVLPYVVGFTNSLVSVCVISSLAFCDSSINHFFCDTTALLALSCVDAFNTEMVIFVLAGFTLLSSLLIITITYIAIIIAILKIQSAAGRQKAFSTCASHLMGVTIFYGSLIFTYLQPDNTSSLTQAQVASVFYTIVIPMLNPLIYSLRNKDVKNALLRILKRKCIQQVK